MIRSLLFEAKSTDAASCGDDAMRTIAAAAGHWPQKVVPGLLRPTKTPRSAAASSSGASPSLSGVEYPDLQLLLSLAQNKVRNLLWLSQHCFAVR